MKNSEEVGKYFNGHAVGYNMAYENPDSLRSYIFDERKRIVLSMLELKTGRVLDVGCGPAVYTDRLSDPSLEVYGVDPSEQMIAIAKSKNFTNAKFSVGKAEKLDFNNGFFDAVLCIGVLEYLSDVGSGVREIARVTRAGGTVVFTAPNKSSILNKLDLALRGVMRMIHKVVKLGAIKKAMDHEYEARFLDPKALETILSRNGFDIADRRYHIFRLSFLNKISPRLSLWIAKKMNFISNSLLGINYIVKCKKR